MKEKLHNNIFQEIFVNFKSNYSLKCLWIIPL